MLSFSLILPELFDYLTQIGGKDHKGYIVFLFSLTAILSRPISGQLTDTIGRKPVILIGLFVCFLSGLLYPFATTVLFFLCLRAFHGIAAGFTPTANSAAVVDVVPESKRGEALGFIGFCTSLGMTFGPVLGSWTKINYGFNFLFITSSFVSLISLLLVSSMKETLIEKKPHDLNKINKESFLEPLVLFPALVYLFYIISYSVVFTIIPDFSSHLGIKNKGLFFLVSIGSSAFIRIISGKLSDKIGRTPFLFVGIFFLILSMWLIGSATNKSTFLMGGVLIGLSVGIATPSVMAWSSDLADTRFLGRSFSTMFLSMEIGISIASLLSSFIYNNQPENFPKTFYLMSLFGFISLILLYFGNIKQKIVKKSN
jgi:MFS family permease